MFIERAAAARRELHEAADVAVRRDDAELDPRLLDRLDLADFGELGRVVDRDPAAVHRQLHPVLDRGRGGDEVEVELALEALLDDLHVEQPQEAAAEPEPERDRALRLVRERGVVEVQLLERVAQERVVRAAERVQAGEHEALRLLEAGQGLGRRLRDGRHRVADLRLAHVLQAGRDVAHLARHELLDRHQLRAEHAQLQELRLRAARHQPDDVVAADRARREADVAEHALVRVVVRVEHERLELVGRVALGWRDPRHDRLQDLGDAEALLRGREDHLLARDGEHVLELLHDELGLGRGQVDLVDDRDDRQALAQGEVDVGQRLGLDPLRGVDDEDRALARLEAAADLVGEVDVPGRVDQVEAVERGRRPPCTRGGPPAP